MAGFDASRATGGQKVKENGTIPTVPYHTTASMPRSGLAGPLVPGYLGYLGQVQRGALWGRPHLPIIVGPWGTLGLARLAELAGLGELTLVNLAVSPCGLGVICT